MTRWATPGHFQGRCEKRPMAISQSGSYHVTVPRVKRGGGMALGFLLLGIARFVAGTFGSRNPKIP